METIEEKSYSIDEIGNIGERGVGSFNDNSVGGHYTTSEIFSSTSNRKKLTNVKKSLEMYLVGNNVIKLLGLPIPAIEEIYSIGDNTLILKEQEIMS